MKKEAYKCVFCVHCHRRHGNQSQFKKANAPSQYKYLLAHYYSNFIFALKPWAQQPVSHKEPHRTITTTSVDVLMVLMVSMCVDVYYVAINGMRWHCARTAEQTFWYFSVVRYIPIHAHIHTDVTTRVCDFVILWMRANHSSILPMLILTKSFWTALIDVVSMLNIL